MVTSPTTKTNRLRKLALGSRRAAPLIAAIVLGAIAAGLGWYYLKTSEREIQQTLESEAERKRSDVVVPTQDLPAGTVLTPDMVAMRRVPTAYVHTDVVTPDDIGNFVGRQITVGVAAGKPLLAGFFATPRKLFSEELEAGVRAVTIPVDEVSSISGMLRAGDHIDFLYLGENGPDRNRDDSVVVPLLQNVVVRATGQITAEQFAELRKRPDTPTNTDPYRQRAYTTVTVGLPPVDAQRLILAQKMGKIVAALRNAEDEQTLSTGTNTQQLIRYIDSFRGPQAEPAAASAAPAGAGARRSGGSIEYIVGNKPPRLEAATSFADLLGSAGAMQSGRP